MVKYGVVSVGVLVEPEACAHQVPKNIFLSLQYRQEMADLIITVSDHDGSLSVKNNNNEKNLNEKNQDESREEIAKYGTLERILDGDGDPDFSSVDSDGVNCSSRSTIRNRPSCRKSRSDSKIQLCNSFGNSKSYNSSTGQKNSFSAYKSCDYYRQKLYDEGLHPGTSDWLNYSHIQKTAGQKVVNKLVQQQKALETEAEQQRKKSSLLGSNSSCSSSDSENRSVGSGGNYNNGTQLYHNLIPPRKKTVRLEPIPFHSVKINE